MSQATRPLSRSTVTSSEAGKSQAVAAATATAGASLMRRRVSVRCGSRHVLQSMRAHTAALKSVAAASAIWMHAITTKSRDDGFASSSSLTSLEDRYIFKEYLFTRMYLYL